MWGYVGNSLDDYLLDKQGLNIRLDLQLSAIITNTCFLFLIPFSWVWSEAGQQTELEQSLEMGGFGWPVSSTSSHNFKRFFFHSYFILWMNVYELIDKCYN